MSNLKFAKTNEYFEDKKEMSKINQSTISKNSSSQILNNRKNEEKKLTYDDIGKFIVDL